MKKNKTLRCVLSLLLVLTMVVSLTVPALAAGEEEEAAKGFTWEKVDNGSAPGLKPAHEAAEVADDAPKYAETDTVRVSIILDKASTLDAGFSTKHIGDNASAMSYRASLKADQVSMTEAISAKALGGKQLDVVWNLTLVANIISANVKFGQIEDIKAVPGVKDVILEKVYSPCVTEMGGVDPMMATSSAMIGSGAAWAEGYTGAGSRIAIIDTGLDTDHQSFAQSGYLHSLEKNAEALGMTYDEYVASLNLLTAEEVAAKWNELNFSSRYRNVSKTYFSQKVPFGANYVDKGVDITHDNDSQGEHGSHVSGIAAANSYIPVNGGFEPALESVRTQGVAPDAQLIVMKVFGKGGGAYDADYMVAIEDAIMLDCDAVNLSLGSANAGTSGDSTYQNILDSLASSDTVVAMSAGNAGTWADETYYGYLYSDGADLDTVGSPGSFTNAFTVASADNDGATGGYLVIDGEMVFYSETSGPNAPISTIAGDHDFVYFDNAGADGNGASLFTDAVSGKIAVCNRGTSSFYQKMDAAAKAGAIACIVVNNQPGVINMALDDATTKIPCVSVTQDIGAVLKSVSEYKDGYYAGSLKVSDGIASVNYNSDYYVMSSFSSMGVPGSLELKPEISAPGGSIYSVNGAIKGGKAYELMSGTSMASPQIAGMTAVVAQYIRENGLEETTGLSARQLAQSLLMSTAVPQIEADSGSYYPVMKQGAGLANVSKAIESGSYVMMAEGSNAGAADGKIKVELGDDPDRTGSYSFSFTLNNMEDTDKVFDLSSAFFTQDLFVFEDDGDVFIDTWTAPLAYGIGWSVDGKVLKANDFGKIEKCDFNGDKTVDINDGQALLDYIVGKSDSIENEDKAELDGVAGLSVNDALEFFNILNTSGVTVPANGSVNIAAFVNISNLDDYDDCGAYVEGYVFADERVSPDGALGDSHSIPVLGYYGGWDESSMFDVGSYVEYAYGLETRAPYMYAAAGDKALNFNSYLVNYAGDSVNYYFGGNPLMDEDTYMPERNAINGEIGDKIAKLQFTAIRNASASRFSIVDSEGNVYQDLDLGEVDCAFYYESNQTWQSTNYSLNVGFAPKGIPEGTELTMKLTLAPEYYVAADGSVDWDALDDAASFAMPVVIDNTAPEITAPAVVEDQLTFTASDNQYIAAVAFYDYEGNMLDVVGSDELAEKGAAADYAFDLVEGTDKYLVEVYDYALNLSTYKLNLNTEELENDVSIVLSDNEIEIFKGTTYKLTAEVGPWGADDTVTWASSDESVATVNEKGIVTAVGVGECVITAVPAADESKSAQCAVTVSTIDFALSGVLQDTEGVPQTFSYNLRDDASWVGGVEIEPYIGTACALNASNIVVMSSEGNYDTYVVSASTGETVATGTNVDAFPYWDMCASKAFSGYIYGVYGPYFFPVEDPLAVDTYGYNLSSYLAKAGANYFITIESMGTFTQGRTTYEALYALDDAGNMWTLNMYASGANAGNLKSLGSEPSNLNLSLPGYDDFLYTSMVVADDEYGTLFLSAFDGSTNLLFMLEEYSDGAGNYFVIGTPCGDVGQDVWPAALTGATYLGAPDAASNRVKPLEAAAARVGAEMSFEKVSLTEAVNEVEGSLNSAAAVCVPEKAAKRPIISILSAPGKFTGVDASYLILDVTATDKKGNDAATNGAVISIDYDEAALELVETEVFAQYYSVKDNKLAYVDLEGIPAGQTVAKLMFKVLDDSALDIKVVTEQAATMAGGLIVSAPVTTALTPDDMTAHKTMVIDAVEPTCTEEGYTGDVYCFDCGKVHVYGEVIPALGHSFSEIWTIDAENHWHDATCGHDEIDALAAHLDEDFDHKCDVCEYVMSFCVDADHDFICDYCKQPYHYITVEGETSVFAGKSIKLTGIFETEAEVETTMVWTLSDGADEFVTVKAKNNVLTLTAKKVTAPATVILTASAADGSFAPATVEINVIPLVSAVSIFNGDENVTNGTVTLDLNQDQNSVELSAVVAPEGAKADVTWTTSNKKLATVDENGLVSVLGTGKLTVTAKSTDGTNKSAKVTLNVIRAATAINILEAPETMQGGKSVTLKTDVQSDKTLTDKNVTWSVDEASAAYASISNGKLTTKAVYAPVVVKVTAAVTARPELSQTVNVRLLPAPTAAYIYSNGMLTSKDTVIACDIGETVELVGACYPASAFGTGAWKSSNAKIASVEDGVVTGIKAGTATITYTFNGKSAAVKVMVGKPVTEITFTDVTDELRSDKSFTFKAVTNDDASVKKLTFSLKEASAFCTLSASGKLTAKTVYEPVDVIVVASATDGTGFTAEYTVTLKPKTDDILVIRVGGKIVNDSTLALEAGNTFELAASDEVTSWKVSNAKVASIDEDGVFTALANGSVTVTATTADKRTAKFTVKVATLVNKITVSVKNGAPAKLISGKSLTLVAAVNADAANKKVTWSLVNVADSEYCTVSASGVVKALTITEPVTVCVIATAADGSDSFSDPFAVELYPAATGVSVFFGGKAVNDLTVNSSETELKLDAKVYSELAQQGVLWKSSNAKIATIDEEGNITVLKAGKVTFTATAADGSAKSAKVTFVFG